MVHADMKTDSIIRDDVRNISKHIPKDSIDLSIVVPPYHNLDDDPKQHIKLIVDMMKQITHVTRIGGICCLVISEDISSDVGMDITELEAFNKIKTNKRIWSKWYFPAQIAWMKDPRKSIEKLNPIENGIIASFDQTPFSFINILVRTDLVDDSPPLDITKRINRLRISEKKKEEMFDSMWFIQPKSEKGFKDRIPKELALRLVMLFSDENDAVLDPFAGHGIISMAAKTLKRHFICIEKNSKNLSLIKTRLNSI